VGNFNNSEYDSVNPLVTTALPLLQPGSRLINTLDRNYRVDLNYRRSIGGSTEAFGAVGYSRSGDRLQGNGLVVQPYELVNATLGIRSGRHEVALVGTNIRDERGPTFLGTTGPNSGQGPTPRTIGVRFRLTH
jgi:hypothetical protein